MVGTDVTNEEGETVVVAAVGLAGEMDALVGSRVGMPLILPSEGPALDSMFRSDVLGMPDGVDPLLVECNGDGVLVESSTFKAICDSLSSTSGALETPLKARFGASEEISRQDINRNITLMCIGRLWCVLFLLTTIVDCYNLLSTKAEYCA